MTKSIFDNMSEEEFIRFAVDCGIDYEILKIEQHKSVGLEGTCKDNAWYYFAKLLKNQERKDEDE